jgi:hypothetical protein
VTREVVGVFVRSCAASIERIPTFEMALERVTANAPGKDWTILQMSILNNQAVSFKTLLCATETNV